MTDEATKLLREWVELTDATTRMGCEYWLRLASVIDRARAYLSRPAEQATVPPREPTLDMVIAGARVTSPAPRVGDSRRAEEVWKAMYDAAIAEGKP